MRNISVRMPTRARTRKQSRAHRVSAERWLNRRTREAAEALPAHHAAQKNSAR
jgi:hypothetical protein